ncbi:hypothetical protein ACFL20_12870, partial [Spirochaetota bacterium]
IYRQFNKIKEESNKVLEVQEKTYRAIQEIKEKYKKAYKAIMGRYQDDRNRILNKSKFDNVKPKIK